MIKEELLSKNGTAIMKLSRTLLSFSIGERIPTITEFSRRFDLARGTIQNALKNLINSDAIELASKGHLGSYLVRKNNAMLLQFAGITYLVGAMPLPYTKRYEGLASGIIISSENVGMTPLNLAYMRGAKSRMNMVDYGRYDFAIVSRFAAEQYISEKNTLEIALSFGKGSYTDKHVLMFRNSKNNEIRDGMKVGVDDTSYDQMELVRKVCEGKNVEYIPIEYSRTIECLQNGDIDATVMNIDEVTDKKVPIHYADIEGYDDAKTEAVVVYSRDREEIGALLREHINVTTVLSVQELIRKDKIIPRY